MRNFLLGALSAGALVALAATATALIFVFSLYSKADAICRVFQQNDAAVLELRRHPILGGARFRQSIGAIDAKACPSDFQAAWQNYAASLRDRGGRDLAAGILEFHAGSPAGFASVAKAFRKGSAPRSAFARCKEVASHYGVEFKDAPAQVRN